MSWTLGIDSSTAELGVGLYYNDTPIAANGRYVANSHSEHLCQSIDFLLSSNALRPADIQRIGIAVGPGSFTGLRIGLAFVKGCFFEQPVRVLPISSLHSLAMAWQGCSERLFVAFDARRDQLFWACFSRTIHGTQRLSADKLSVVGELSAALKPGDVVLCDTLGYSKSTLFSTLPASVTVVPIQGQGVQRGLACAAIAATHSAESDWVTPLDVQPQYMQLSAPEQIKQNAIQCGR
jgi:tRNA threonylcarbamoyladenosine biosynthesis protein TsaB